VQSDSAAPRRESCVMHERNGGYHEPCVHCQLAEARAEGARLRAELERAPSRPLMVDALTMIGRGAHFEVADGRLKVGPLTINLEAFDPAADAEIPDVHDDPSWSPDSAARFGAEWPPSPAEMRAAAKRASTGMRPHDD
jgi:hypothetical protein